jgi:antitoxin MazE
MEEEARTQQVQLVPIGNSKGIRLPKAIIQKYGFSDTLLLEETEQGILLRSVATPKLSWEETFKAMAAQQEDWDDFESTLLDGLDHDEFDSQAV